MEERALLDNCAVQLGAWNQAGARENCCFMSRNLSSGFSALVYIIQTHLSATTVSPAMGETTSSAATRAPSMAQATETKRAILQVVLGREKEKKEVAVLRRVCLELFSFSGVV